MVALIPVFYSFENIRCCWLREIGGMVVKIAIQLVKSYDFTSQYRLNVLNRVQNSEMDKIRSKSGKIVKIG